MRTVKAEDLSAASFLPFGFYANLIDPDTEKIGAPPIEFFRDMMQQNLGQTALASFSNCRVEPRPPLVNALECHSRTAEVMLPLDNDVLMQLAPATPGGSGPALDKLKAFRVPSGTLVVLRPGVWHHAPFTVNQKPVNILIVLPERTYANDCTAVDIPAADQPKLEF